MHLHVVGGCDSLEASSTNPDRFVFGNQSTALSYAQNAYSIVASAL